METDNPPDEPGTYILVMFFRRDLEVEVGSLGMISLRSGRYAYVGSAKKGIRSRVKRHLGDPVRKRWHIDRIANLADDRKVFWKEFEEGDECAAASVLERDHSSVHRFGSSDCRCPSHLFYLSSG